MKKLLIAIALYVAFMSGQAFEAHRQADCNNLPTEYDFSGIDYMENYIMDVVDETDFWYECDSTAFNMYDENSPEWMVEVIAAYNRWAPEYYSSNNIELNLK
jgi:hypothetical protein